jgi:uncharacterized protein (DUF305 family)
MKITPMFAAPAALLLLAACGAETDTETATGTGEMDHSGHGTDGAMGADAKAELTEAQAAYKAANDAMHAGMADIPVDPDVAFMEGMLAHHQGAVAMSEVALKYAKDAQARDLAARVIAAQKEEIAEMEAWLKERSAK